jgi:hypothetical protein
MGQSEVKCPYKKCIAKAKQGERTRASGNQTGGKKNDLLTLENGEKVNRFEFYSERGNSIDLDPLYLADLFHNQQKGLCAYTGHPIDMNDVFINDKLNPRWLMQPSLERINNVTGYMRGNVRIVTMYANLAFKDYRGDKLEASKWMFRGIQSPTVGVTLCQD